jgi:hypothetical protein
MQNLLMGLLPGTVFRIGACGARGRCEAGKANIFPRVGGAAAGEPRREVETKLKKEAASVGGLTFLELEARGFLIANEPDAVDTDGSFKGGAKWRPGQ